MRAIEASWYPNSPTTSAAARRMFSRTRAAFCARVSLVRFLGCPTLALAATEARRLVLMAAVRSDRFESSVAGAERAGSVCSALRRAAVRVLMQRLPQGCARITPGGDEGIAGGVG